MRRTAILLLVCMSFMIFAGGCDLVKAGEALRLTLDTMGSDESKKPDETDPYIPSVNVESTDLQKIIREENKPFTIGLPTDSVQWVNMYEKQLFPGIYDDIKEIKWDSGGVFGNMSASYSVNVDNIIVSFNDVGSVVLSTVSVYENDKFGTFYLVDIIDQSTLTGLFDDIFIFNVVKSDPRFSDKFYDSHVKDKMDDGVVKIDVTELLPEYFGEYRFEKFDINYLNASNVELCFRSEKDAKKVLYDLNNKNVISTEDWLISEYVDERTARITSPDGQHEIYLDEKGDLYVHDIQTDDIWVVAERTLNEAVSINGVVPHIYKIYKNKLIYTFGLYEGSGGFGIYDFKNNTNVVYTDPVYPAGIQNGKLILIGSIGYDYEKNPPLVALDLDSENYDVMFNNKFLNEASVVVPENKDFLILFDTMYEENSPYKHVVVKILKTIDFSVVKEYNIYASGASPQYVSYKNDRIIIACETHYMSHERYFTIDYR